MSGDDLLGYFLLLLSTRIGEQHSTELEEMIAMVVIFRQSLNWKGKQLPKKKRSKAPLLTECDAQNLLLFADVLPELFHSLYPHFLTGILK